MIHYYLADADGQPFAKLLAGAGLSATLAPDADGVPMLTLAATGTLTETDPFFAAWLAATPPLYAETDPVFTAWLATTPPLYAETDPVFTAWLATAPNISAFTNDAGYLTAAGAGIGTVAGIVKGDGAGNPSAAVDGTDYWSPASLTGVSQLTNDAGYVASAQALVRLMGFPEGLIRCDGETAFYAATPGVDYLVTEADPVFTAWLATTPGVSAFTNDAGYLTSVPPLMQLRDANGTAIFDAENYLVASEYGDECINLLSRALVGGGVNVLQWANGVVISDLMGNWSLDGVNRKLYDANGSTLIAQWGNGDGTLRDGTGNAFLTSEAEFNTWYASYSTNSNFATDVQSVVTSLGAVLSANGVVDLAAATITNTIGLFNSSNVGLFLGYGGGLLSHDGGQTFDVDWVNHILSGAWTDGNGNIYLTTGSDFSGLTVGTASTVTSLAGHNVSELTNDALYLVTETDPLWAAWYNEFSSGSTFADDVTSVLVNYASLAGWLNAGGVASVALLLDQTTPQTIVNGAPNFSEGLVTPCIQAVFPDGTIVKVNFPDEYNIELLGNVTVTGSHKLIVNGDAGNWLTFDGGDALSRGDPNFQNDITINGNTYGSSTPFADASAGASWAAPVPTTTDVAINRLAAALAGLLGTPIP